MCLMKERERNEELGIMGQHHISNHMFDNDDPGADAHRQCPGYS